MNANKFVTQYSTLNTQHGLNAPLPLTALSTQHSTLFEFRPYQRRFTKPLITHHGVWDTREGIILRLVDEAGKIGWGEIAPISWFGSETLEKALDFCHQLPQEITPETIFAIPDDLPACQFGFESALGDGVHTSRITPLNPPLEMGETGKPSSGNQEKLVYSGLLPAGEVALQQWETLWERGYRTFKWKIGVDAIAKELAIFDNLTRSLPASAKLRLDANGGLSYTEAKLWLETCDNIQGELPIEIEFLEQPLPVEELAAMLELSRFYKTAIALDESVATLPQIISCYQQGWRGIFVIKPGIVGSPSKLRHFCQQHQIDAVFSSVFETVIGKQAALNLAAELSRKNRAVGFGVDHFFVQAEVTSPENLWNNL
ncbi:o-succinylbenzoate synthase [Nostoc sp. LEGE 06077]|uniref:o-succinylbenzoate synthase n=1 Tax=Nostoc sp. LEGE 06077 TaxID=915325 RepID=UPI00187E5A60|nr:o-succinylbenzoate synthase [Nostoc sp. LEGE 06077]MBE9209098.1 o-succinylbenzoate synthase [Nostoc sp. LEGE 06077]